MDGSATYQDRETGETGLRITGNEFTVKQEFIVKPEVLEEETGEGISSVESTGDGVYIQTVVFCYCFKDFATMDRY